MSVRYHLRFQIHPYEGTDSVAVAAAELAKTCTGAGVDEVVLLLGAEEHFTGHLAGPEEDLWFDAAATAQEVLLGAGLEVSLNPWVTAGHADRGRTGAHGFAPMVSPDGEVSAAQASFACPRWRAWLSAHYGRFAELGFRVLWLEDDFRFHNHAPLGWGGGFEPLMLERLADLAGRPVPRPELVAALTAPGPPHPLRVLWQQVWRTAQLEVAAQVAAEVHRRSAGRSRTGLMSSGLDAASVEGRDWGALFGALAPGGRAVHRPHFAPYSDAPGRELSRQLWMLELQRSLRPDFVGSEPEIENWPHTSWSKSDAQTWSEMVAAQLSGADALLLNLYPVHGGSPGRHPRIPELLERARPALDLVGRQHPREQRTFGVGLPFAQDAAAHVRAHGGGLAELAVDPGPAADLLLRCGVPVTAGPAPVQALFGPSADAFDDTAVRALLAGGLLLDGVAAVILHRRGFGALIGLQEAETVGREASAPGGPGPYATEHLGAAAGEEFRGLVLSVNAQPALARLREAPGAERWSEVRTPDGRPWGAARTAFANALGGRVAVLAATDARVLPLDDHAQRLLHRTVRFLEGPAPALPLVSGGPYLIPHLSYAYGATTLTVANGCQDPARPVVDLPRLPDGTVAATLLAPLAEPRPADTAVHGQTLRFGAELPHRGWAVLRW